MKRGMLCFLSVCTIASLLSLAAPIIEVTDQMDQTVAVSTPVERIVSVYGMGTYYLYALGASDRLVRAWYVGVKTIAQAPEEMFRFEPHLEELLTSGDPSIEEMIALDPDLILVDGSRHGAFAEQMLDLGVPVLQFCVETPERLQEALLLVAETLGGEAQRRAALFGESYHRITATVAEDLALLAAADRARVLFIGTDLLRVASGDMYQTLLLEAAGGSSVSAELSGSWNEVSMEQVLLWNPDVIIIPPYGPVQPSDILDDPVWQSVAAVRDGRVHRMPRYIAPMDTPVPESLLGVAWLASVLYPEQVSIDLASEVHAFYATYYGMPLSEEELEALTRR